MQGLKEAPNACIETEEAVKSGNLNDVLSIEMLIIESVSNNQVDKRKKGRNMEA